jgi:anti-sigma regulatory factor (Ser/Thr protein kinase)
MAEPVLHLRSALADLGQLYPWLDDAAALAAVPAELLPGMHVALEEAVANVAMHAYPQNAPGPIVVRLRSEPDAAVLEIEDEGPAFDPTAAEVVGARPAALDDVVPGGWGLGLIRRYATGLAYAREAGRNRLTMRFAPSGGVSRPPA